MMPSRSVPSLRPAGSRPQPVLQQRDGGSPPSPPVRDASTLKAVRCGPGHEKFPSWPVPAAAESPPRPRLQGGSSRSKSWTECTDYPKETVVSYVRPYMKRQTSQHVQQTLKTVMEKCEKIPPESFTPRYDTMESSMYYDSIDHQSEKHPPSTPPELDISVKPHLTKEDLEQYARSYQEPVKFSYDDAIQTSLTKMEDFMDYSYSDSLFSTMSYKHDEGLLGHHHQKQLSYAQSEGYHSYVSSTDSTSTPFLDRLRRDSEAVVLQRPYSAATWDDASSDHKGRDSVVTTSSGSASSSETLKWHGSISDVSVASSCNHHGGASNSSGNVSRSGKVVASQKGEYEWKHRESRNNKNNKLKLFPVNTYTVQDRDMQNSSGISSNSSNSRLSISLQSAQSVAERISELEKQKYSYLDPEKRHKVPDPTLKAIQKKALLSFYERHHNPPNKPNQCRSEPQLFRPKATPPPPPKVRISVPSRRASSASDYASGNNSKRSSLASTRESKTTDNIQSKITPKHQHSNSCGSLSTDLVGPVIIGPSIYVDDFIPKPPERPPKDPHLRFMYPDLFKSQRLPSPDLPPPSPPAVLDDEVFNNDEPLPPPPPECGLEWQGKINDRLKGTSSSQSMGLHSNSQRISSKMTNDNMNLVKLSGVRSSIKTLSTSHLIQQVSSRPYHGTVEKPKREQIVPIKPDYNIQVTSIESQKSAKNLDFPSLKGYVERSNTKYPSSDKIPSCIAVSEEVSAEVCQAEPLNKGIKRLSSDQTVKPKIGHRQVNVSPSKLSIGQRCSIAESGRRETPPPLQPRHAKVNQSMRTRSTKEQKITCCAPKMELMKAEDEREGRSQSMSQSKASYLSSKREKDRLVVGSDTGSYKRTMSPNGRVFSESMTDLQNLNNGNTMWPLKRDKISISTSSINLTRKSSLKSKFKQCASIQEKCDEKDNLKKSSYVLPDVLPLNAKLFTSRSQESLNTTHLTLSPIEISPRETSRPRVVTPASSPPKSPSKSPRTSPLQLPQPKVVTVELYTSTPPPPASPIKDAAPRILVNSSTSPSSPKRLSPQIKPSLISPSSLKLSSKLSFSSVSSSSSGSSPLQISPLNSPPSSPKSTKSNVESPVETSDGSLEAECSGVIEGLKMIQRTEVVLRVNTSMADASSQTEKDEMLLTPLPTRKKLQEEIECEILSEDLLSHLPTSERLKDLLVPCPEHKKPSDYVSGLFRTDVTSKPRSLSSPFRSKSNTPSSSPPPQLSTATINLSTIPTITSLITPIVTPVLESPNPLSGNSTYYTTSESKAKLLTRFSQDMSQLHIVKDTKDLNQKKVELVSRLDRKLQVLRGEQVVVSEECRINDELGQSVETHVANLARPHEVAKLRLHVQEVGKITSLLLGLSGRLARAENALMGMEDDHPEKRILENKRDKLLEQLEEAKKLKESIDKRSLSVSNILYKYLNSEEYADYDHYINMKAKLIMDSKEIADKIKLGEEQLMALKETLIVVD